MKDKAYRASFVGGEVGRFMRSMRWADRTQNSLDTYEIVLSRLSTDFADVESLDEIGTDMLRDFLDSHWGECSPATRRNRLAVVRSFFKWAVDEGRMRTNPASPIRAPKRQDVERSAYPRDTIEHLIAAQPSLRDQCALRLLGTLGLRKNEVRLCQVKHVDLSANTITVFGKGGRVAVMPLAFKELRDALYLHIVGDERQPEEYLVYPKGDRDRPMDPASLHRWLKACLKRAGLPDSIKTHELRHSSADNMWRVTGDIVKAQMLLRHRSPATTAAYLHPRREDLADAMRAVDSDWAERSS
jgi:site-specific recombinase XerD